MPSNGASKGALEIGELVQEAQLAREHALHEESDVAERKLLFVLRISGFLVGLPAAQVQSVIATDAPCPLPMAPDHVLGLVPHSDGALAVVDLSRFLDLGPSTDTTSTHRIVVVRSGELEAGLWCDQALGVHSAGEDELASERVLRGGELASYTDFECQLAFGRVACVDLSRVLQAMQLRA